LKIEDNNLFVGLRVKNCLFSDQMPGQFYLIWVQAVWHSWFRRAWKDWV